jgi:hypothetical protein
MLVSARIQHALAEKRDAFQQAGARRARAHDRYDAALTTLSSLTCTQINEQLGGIPWPGARPTREFDQRSLIIPFNLSWPTAQEARAWALERLRGVPTAAVDGSQIPASREFDVPICLVQVGWFENFHHLDRRYIKDVRYEVITPDEPPDDVAEYAFADSRLNQRRFTLEIETAVDCVRRLSPDPPPVVFHDGTLVLSFAGRMPAASRDIYLQALFTALDASRECRVPIVGYVDRSLAADLVTMVRHAADLSPGPLIDAVLLTTRMNLFDRTCAFCCARADIIPQYRTDDRDYTEDLCFIYLKTGHDRLPARIDFPSWIVDAGLLDHVVDIIRAEIIAGSGYPYALETADAAAVLTTEDRLAFFRLWQEFAAAEGLDAALPGKTVSKQHRR